MKVIIFVRDRVNKLKASTLFDILLEKKRDKSK